MRKFFTAVVASGMILGVAAFAQQQPTERPQTAQPTQRTTDQADSGKSMSAQEAAEMFRYGKHSLADSISVAERKVNGKAIAAHCCMETQDEINRVSTNKSGRTNEGSSGSSTGTSGNSGSSGNSAGTTGNNNAEQTGKQTRTTGETMHGDKRPVCIVTCLVDNNRLEKVVVCSQSNEVLAQCAVTSIGETRTN